MIQWERVTESADSTFFEHVWLFDAPTDDDTTYITEDGALAERIDRRLKSQPLPPPHTPAASRNASIDA